MAILLTVFRILFPLSAYNTQITSSIYYQPYYYSLYSYILNLISILRPYLLLSLSIQPGRYITKYLQKFARLFYPTSLTILLYARNQCPKSRLDYLVSPSLIQISPIVFLYYPYPRLYPYRRSILLYSSSPSYLRPLYPYYYSTIFLAPAPIERLYFYPTLYTKSIKSL